MNVRLQLGVVAGFLLATTAASADVPKYADLPKGSLTSPPDDAKKPAAIPAKEKVDGFNVGAQKFDAKVPMGARHVTVFGTAAQAEALSKGEFGGEDDGSICFSEANRGGGMSFDEDADDESTQPQQRDWDSSQQSQVHLWLKTKDNPSGGIMAVHSEKVVEKDGAVSLETADAWVDPATKGARLIAKSSLPMKLMGTAMNGFKVFAARDERAGAKKRVQFVFMRGENQHAQIRNQGMMAILSDGMGSMGSGCRHLRVSLPVEEKGGESAVISATIELPSANPDDKKKDEAKDEAKKAKPGKFRGFRGRSLGGGEEKEIRVRELQSTISVSKSTRDKEPLVSVSFGWATRETTQRVFDVDD